MASKNVSERGFVCCLNCKYGTFMQWFENPIVADCSMLHERTVAQSKRICKFYFPSGKTDPEITHYNDYDEARAKQRRDFFGYDEKS